MWIIIVIGLLLASMGTHSTTVLFSLKAPIRTTSAPQPVPAIHVNSYTKTTEIRVFDTASLAAYASSGSGIASDPYIVENYNITATLTNPPLYISGITDYFIIRNNIIDGQNSSTISSTVPAVQIYGSQHITLENNIIMNAKIGIYDLSSSNNIYRDQTFVHIQGLSSQTIKFYQTTNNIIEYLDFVNKADSGIYLADTVGTMVRNTTIHDGATGLEITRSGVGFGQDNMVYNSTFMDTTSPAIRDWGYNNTFANNTFLRNYEAINIFQGDNSIIENNTFTGNTYGITFSTSSDVIVGSYISFNTFQTGNKGLYALNADIQQASILNNTFTGNNYGVDWDLNSGAKNNFTYNLFKSNNYGMSLSGNTGVNASFNFIRDSISIGISLSSAENTLILNNTIARSSSNGLSVVGSIITSSIIRFNDFMGNGGTGSQVYAYIGVYTIDKNYYSDHTNIDLNNDGYADSSYNFDGGSYNDPTPLVSFSVPYSYIDTTPPSVIFYNTTKVIVEYGSTSNKLVWTATDQNPDNYTIEIDGQPLVSHTSIPWTSVVPVVMDLADFYLGTYDVHITFSDNKGNEAAESVTLIIQDSTVPEITQDITTQNNLQLGKYKLLNWTATDLLPSNFSLWVDNQQIEHQEQWVSGQQYSVDISLLNEGPHNITLQLLDLGNNSATRYYIFNLTTEATTSTTTPETTTDTVDSTSNLSNSSNSNNSGEVSVPFSNFSVIITGVMFIQLLLRSTIRYKEQNDFQK